MENISCSFQHCGCKMMTLGAYMMNGNIAIRVGTWEGAGKTLFFFLFSFPSLMRQMLGDKGTLGG